MLFRSRASQGQRGIELVLSAHFSLTGQLLVDPGVDPGAVRVKLKRSDAETVVAERRRGGTADDGAGRFALRPAPAGEYELRCLLEDQELARIRGLVLRSDLDLGEVDLRGKVRVCEIELLGAEDPAKLGGEVFWKARGTDEEHRGRIEGNRVRIPTTSVPIDVAVRPRGYRHALLEGVSGRREVMLERPLEVRLVLETSGEFPQYPYLLKCHVSQGHANVSEPRGMSYFTEESREVELTVSAAGSLRVCWDLERRVEGANFGGARGSGILDGHEVEIEVLDVPGVQVFPIQLDGAALTKLAHHPPW